MYLAPDFPGTSLFQVTTTANNKSAWRASFGLIHAENLHEIPDIDDKILCFLRRAVICKEREHAIVTLQGGDAQRTLDIMQNVSFRSISHPVTSNYSPLLPTVIR